jgi:hypothetical protein
MLNCPCINWWECGEGYVPEPPFFHEGERLIAKLRHFNDCKSEWLAETEESWDDIRRYARYHLNIQRGAGG